MRNIVSVLGSRSFATALILSWIALLAVWIIPFQFYGLPTEQLQRIVYQEPFFQLVYALIVLNGVACVVVRLRSKIRQSIKMPGSSSCPRVPDAALAVEVGFDPARVSTALRAAGYRRMVEGDGWAWGVRNRWSPLGTVASHAGMVIVAVGILWSLQPGAVFSGTALVAEGETFTGDAAQYRSVDATPAPDEFPDVRFTLRDVDTSFYRDMLLFTQLDGVLETESGSRRRFSLASPHLVSPTTMVAVEDFGYAPSVTVKDARGVIDGPVIHKLKVFPPGSVDTFSVHDRGAGEFEIAMEVFGDAEVRDGVLRSKSFNLTDPRIRVDVTRVTSVGARNVILEHAVVAPGDSIEFEGVTLQVDEMREFGVFRIARMTPAPLLAAGLALVMLGLTMRLAFPRREALVATDGDSVLVSARQDVYRENDMLQARLAELLAEGR